MLKRILLGSVLALLIPFFGMSQSDVERIILQLQFDKDKHELRAGEITSMREALAKIGECEMLRVYINGHTDSDAEEDYNLKLSKRRVEAVSDFLDAQGVSKKLHKTNYFGESRPAASNAAESGMQVNRRVEVVLKYVSCYTLEEEQPEPEVKLPDTCRGRDTILILPGGSQVEMNICEYWRVKDCLEIKEYNDPQSVYDAGLTTADDQGIVMGSCGMIGIGLGAPCENCFDRPVTVRMPMPDPECNACLRERAGFFMLSQAGAWSQVGRNKAMKRVKVDGRDYYEFKIRCANKYNCDCKFCTIPLKVKTTRDIELDNAYVVLDCPMAAAAYPGKRKAHKMKFFMPHAGYTGVHIWATGSDKFGVALKVDALDAETLLRKRRFPWLTICRYPKGERPRWKIKRYPRKIHRVYKIRTEDWEVK